VLRVVFGHTAFARVILCLGALCRNTTTEFAGNAALPPALERVTMQKYFFDLTATLWHLRRVSRFSGIQRAVIMLVDRAADLVGRENVHLSFLDRNLGRYRTFPLSALGDGELVDSEALRARLGLGKSKEDVHPILRKYADKPLKLFFHRSVLQLNGFLGREAPFRQRNSSVKDWRQFNSRHHTSGKTIIMQSFDDVAEPGDRLILLDSVWTVAKANAVFREAREKGLKTSTMIYDMIPIVAPEYVTGISSLVFHDWLLTSREHTDQFLAGSVSTGEDLTRFLRHYGIDTPVRAVPLAQSPLPGSVTKPSEGPLERNIDHMAFPRLRASAVVDERLRAIAAYPYVLCVGTLEIRKNIWRLATAWERLRQIEGVQIPKLVFAGQKGWMIDDFDRLMQATGNLQGWVEIVQGPSDRELEYLYRNCLFLAMPSMYEGWGLPVGEVLSYGKTAVVSNTSSLPEVGKDMVVYCNPSSIDSIVEACLGLIVEAARREEFEKKIRTAKLRSWEDVAQELVMAITAD
jgi:glycosyltransferase involved in cell wall biosynthesis